jgi:hypothetical protein
MPSSALVIEYKPGPPVSWALVTGAEADVRIAEAGTQDAAPPPSLPPSTVASISPSTAVSNTRNTSSFSFSIGTGMYTSLNSYKREYGDSYYYGDYEYMSGTISYRGYFDIYYLSYLQFSTVLHHNYTETLSSRNIEPNWTSPATRMYFSLDGKYPLHVSNKLTITPSVYLEYFMPLYQKYQGDVMGRDDLKINDSLLFRFGGELNYSFTEKLRTIINLRYYAEPMYPYRDDTSGSDSVELNIEGSLKVTEYIRGRTYLLYNNPLSGERRDSLSLNIGGYFSRYLTGHIWANVDFDYYIQLYDAYNDEVFKSYSSHGPRLLLRILYYF